MCVWEGVDVWVREGVDVWVGEVGHVCEGRGEHVWVEKVVCVCVVMVRGRVRKNREHM